MDVVVCVDNAAGAGPSGRPGQTTATPVGERRLLGVADAGAVEAALRLVEAAGTGTVVVVSASPGGSVGALRRALAMGADRGILIADAALGDCDSLGAAKVLAAAVTRAGAGGRRGLPDLVVAGIEPAGGCAATLPVQVAELLGLPSVTSAAAVEVVDGKLSGRRRTSHGEIAVECPLPALVTVAAGAVEPRYPSFGAVVAARAKPVERLSLSDLALDPAGTGLGGTGQEATEVVAALVPRAGEPVVDDGDGHLRILALLEVLGAL